MGSSLAEKSVYFLWKSLILNPSFESEGQFYANFSFYILIIYGKYLAFQFLTCGIDIFLPS